MVASTNFLSESFSILDHIEKLTPAKEKNRYICPVCGGNNLTISKNSAYKCWNGCECKDIRDAIAPWEPQRRNTKIININHNRKPAKPKPASLPEAIELTKADGIEFTPAAVTTEQQRDGLTSKQTRFNYADDKWIARHEKLDGNGQRVGKKYYSQHHATNGIEQLKESLENGIVKRTPCKGDEQWPAYREVEACTALRNGGNCLLVVEGEPCTEAGWQLGLATITFQGSSWSFHDGSEALAALKRLLSEFPNFGLLIWPDNDKTGFSKAQKLAESCTALGIWTIQLDPAAFELEEKGDIVDAIASLGSDEVRRRIEQQLQEIIENYQPETEPELEFGGNGGNGGGSSKRGLPYEDVIAEEIAEEYRDRLVYNNENGTWYRHEADAPGVWSAESAEYIESIVNGILRGKGYSGWGENSYITNVIKALRHVLIERKWVERPANELLPFQNGVLELATGKLLPHSPGYRFTWCMPRPHNPLATDWTRISNWMDTALNGNTHLKNVLIAFANAVLRGRSDLQKVLHLIGIGGSGKGTFLRLLVALIGEENCYSTTLEEWCGNRFEAAQAYRKRLVQFPDEDKGVKGLGRFKSLTGGDFLRGEEKNKKPFQFRFDGMVVMVSNFPIFSSDNSSGISRRMITVPFNNMVEESQRRDLDKEFQPELAAFTNYLLNLSDDWVERVLRGVADVPEISLQFWENKIREDSIAGFFNDRLIIDPSAQTAVGNGVDAEGSLYQAYVTYCKDQGQCPKAVKNFSPDLLELCGPTLGLKSIDRVHTKTGKFIKGVRLRTGADNHIGTWDFELREKCKLLGDGCGDGLVTDKVTGHNQDTASISDMVTDKTTIACEKIEPKLAAEINQPLNSQLNSQPDTEDHPSPIPNSPSGKGFDPSPVAVTDASPHPSPMTEPATAAEPTPPQIPDEVHAYIPPTTEPTPPLLDDVSNEEIADCVDYIKTAIASNDPKTAKDIELTLLDTASVYTPQAWSDAKKAIWLHLTPDERQVFKKLLAAPEPAAPQIEDIEDGFKIGDRVVFRHPEIEDYRFNGFKGRVVDVRDFKDGHNFQVQFSKPGYLQQWWPSKYLNKLD